jgi:hypothetical protein
MMIQRQTLIRLAIATLLVAAVSQSAAADRAGVPNSNAVAPGMDLQGIVSRLVRSNQERANALRGFDGVRSYSIVYHGIPGNREAGLEVMAHYLAPSSKSFDVISQSGSKVLQSKVLLKLLESEQEAARTENQQRTALTSDNYNFTLLGSRPSLYGGCYRLEVEPKRDEKFLYRGEICVNAAEFAVESIDVEPAKNPSFWIKKTHIQHRYEKVGQFWLPASNQTVTNVRLGGTATLSILYSHYELH